MPATVTITPTTENGRKHWEVKVSETLAANADEWQVVDLQQRKTHALPRKGTITLYQATLQSGTATTIQPDLGKSPAFVTATQDVINEQASAAASFNDQTPVRYVLNDTEEFYGRSQPDAGADNVIETVFIVVEGHEA